MPCLNRLYSRQKYRGGIFLAYIAFIVVEYPSGLENADLCDLSANVLIGCQKERQNQRVPEMVHLLVKRMLDPYRIFSERRAVFAVHHAFAECFGQSEIS